MVEYNPFDVPEEMPPAFSSAPRPPRKPGKSRLGPVWDRLPGGVRRFLRRFWKIIAAAAALVLVLVIFSGTILAWLAPAWTVGRGMTKAAAAMRERLDESPWGAAETLVSAVQQGSLGFELDTTRDSAAVTLQSNFDERDFALFAEYDIDDDIGDAALYIDRTRVAATYAGLDDVYGVTYKSFEKDLRAAGLPEALDLDEDEVQEMIDRLNRLTPLLDTDPAAVLAGLEDVCGEFLKDLDYESEGAKVKVAGERLSCTAVTAEIGRRDLRDLALGAYDAVADDPLLRNLLLPEFLGRKAWWDAERFQEALQDGRSRIKEDMDEMDCDLEATAYLHRGSLVMLEIQGIADGWQVDITLELGADPSEDDWHFEYTGSRHGNVEHFSADYTSDSSARSRSDRLTLTHSGNGYRDETVEISSDWNKRTGDLDLRVAADDRRTLSARCSLDRDKDSFRLTLDGSLFDWPGGSVALWAEEGGKVESTRFVNLDRWSAGNAESMENIIDYLEWLPIYYYFDY